MIAAVHCRFVFKAALLEWQEARTVRRRAMKRKAFDFCQRRILLKAWKALPIGLKQIRDSMQRRHFTKKMLEKAHEYLAMGQTETLPMEASEDESSLDGSFF
jgi:hypothetical protein